MPEITLAEKAQDQPFEGEVELTSNRYRTPEPIPDEVPPELLSELRSEAIGSTAEEDTTREPVETSAIGKTTIDNPEEDLRLAKLETLVAQQGAGQMQLLNAFKGLVGQMQQNGGGVPGTGTTEQTRDDLISAIAKDLPTSDAEGSTFTTEDGTNLAKTVLTAVEVANGGRLKALEDKTAGFEGALTASSDKERVQQYENHIAKLLDDAKINNSLDREAIELVVTNRGMRQHGQQFNEARATQMFRTVLDERLASEVTAREATAETKQTEANETPAVSHATGVGTSTEGIRTRLADSTDAGMDFSGGDFGKLVRAVMND